MFFKTKKGIVLIACYLMIVVLVILGSAFLVRSINEQRLAQRERDMVQAVYLAEAAIERGMQQLEQDYAWNAGYGSAVAGVPLGSGEYNLAVAANGNRRILRAGGFVPDLANPRVRRNIEVCLQRVAPTGFYDNAVYVAAEVDFNGNAYSVQGDVTYGDGPLSDTDNVTGNVTQDDAASPLPELDFLQLLNTSSGQGNVYDADRLDDVKKGLDSFPSSFWFDQAAGEPNIVYITADLVLNGNIGSVAGFFVVVGDVLTNPDNTEDTTINGNGQIEGCIYTTGEFRINGGGDGLNVNGGIWAGTEVELNGSATVAYNSEYMLAIKNEDINRNVQVLSWRRM